MMARESAAGIDRGEWFEAGIDRVGVDLFQMVPNPFRTPRVNKYVGENGVTVLHQDNPFSRAFCIGVWVKTGTRDERAGEDGLSHFLEHMYSMGTKRVRPREYSQIVKRFGGSKNAFCIQITDQQRLVDDQGNASGVLDE